MSTAGRWTPEDWYDWAALARAVRKRREERGLGSQARVAEQAGVSLNTWGRLEGGTPVSMETVRQAAQALSWEEAAMKEILIGERPAKRATEPPVQASTARDLCEQAVRGAEAGWVSREVGAFAADVLAALGEETAS